MSWSHQTSVGGFYPSLTITSIDVSAHINTNVQFTCSAEHVDNIDIEWVMHTDENHSIIMGYGTDIIFNNPQASHSTITCTAKNQTGTATASQPFLFFNDNLKYVISPAYWSELIDNKSHSCYGFSVPYGRGNITPHSINHQFCSSNNSIIALRASTYWSSHSNVKYRTTISISDFNPINTNIRPTITVNGYTLTLSRILPDDNIWTFYAEDNQLSGSGNSICYELYKIFMKKTPTTILLTLEG